MSQLLPIAPNPLMDRTNKSPLELLREDIQIGQELLASPTLIRYLLEEYQHISYLITHLQPATETDRETTLALNTAISKLAVLEKLYKFAEKLPIAMEAYKEALANDESQSQ